MKDAAFYKKQNEVKELFEQQKQEEFNNSIRQEVIDDLEKAIEAAHKENRKKIMYYSVEFTDAEVKYLVSLNYSVDRDYEISNQYGSKGNFKYSHICWY